MLGFTFFGQKSVLIKFLAYIKNLLFVNLKFSLVLHIPWLIGADHFKWKYAKSLTIFFWEWNYPFH